MMNILKYMFNKRKISSFFLIFLMFFTLSACQKTEQITLPVEEVDFELEDVSNLHSNTTENSVDLEKITTKIDNNDNNEETETPVSETPETVTFTIPTKYDNQVDFVSQAPYANWDLPYKEACEEASLIMAFYGLNNQDLDEETMKQEIDKLVVWQEENFGYYKHTDADDMLTMAQAYFSMSAELIKNPSIERLKKELSDGNLIVAPFAGRQLFNPNYKDPGPLYHAMLIRGYDKKHFITNDPGTRNGEGYEYTYDVLMNALHDYNDGEVESGRKVVIVVKGLGN